MITWRRTKMEGIQGKGYYAFSRAWGSVMENNGQVLMWKEKFEFERNQFWSRGDLATHFRSDRCSNAWWWETLVLVSRCTQMECSISAVLLLPTMALFNKCLRHNQILIDMR